MGKDFCDVEHVGTVVSDCATTAFADGRMIEMHRGDLFYVPKEPHDSWVATSLPSRGTSYTRVITLNKTLFTRLLYP